MKVEPVHRGTSLYQRMQEFAGTHKLLFHSADWLGVYEHEKLTQCAILNNNDEIIGCFLYYTFHKFRFRCIISPPFTPDISLFYLNPSDSVVGKATFLKNIATLLADYFDTRKAAFVQLNLPHHFIDTQPFIWKGYLSRNRYSYLVDLDASPDQLRANMASEKRKSLSKAAKDGLTVQTEIDPEIIYPLICQSLDRNGIHANRQIIRKIVFSFAGKDVAIARVAKQGNQPLGATFCLVSQQQAIYLFGGFDAENKHHGAGVSCMWNSMLDARERGLKWFDFEGSMNPAIERYFREFGGSLTPYFNVQKTSRLMKLLLSMKGDSQY